MLEKWLGYLRKYKKKKFQHQKPQNSPCLASKQNWAGKKKQDNTTHSKEKNSLIETDPALTEMIELVHNIKTAVRKLNELSISEWGTISSRITCVVGIQIQKAELNPFYESLIIFNVVSI